MIALDANNAPGKKRKILPTFFCRQRVWWGGRNRCRKIGKFLGDCYYLYMRLKVTRPTHNTGVLGAVSIDNPKGAFDLLTTYVYYIRITFLSCTRIPSRYAAHVIANKMISHNTDDIYICRYPRWPLNMSPLIRRNPRGRGRETATTSTLAANCQTVLSLGRR